MRMIKWDSKRNEYEPYDVPDDWKCKIYCEDMNEIVNCAHCGKEVKFGRCFTSTELHTGMGFGYAVCADCYEKEIGEER